MEDIVAGKNGNHKIQLFKHNYLQVELLTIHKGFINSLMANTAWDTTKTSGRIPDFDFETTQKLTFISILQIIISEKTTFTIIDVLHEIIAW